MGYTLIQVAFRTRQEVPMQIPGLYRFFHRHIQNGFCEQGLTKPALVDYVSELLTRFARVNVLYPLHGTDGRPLETIASLLMSLQPEEHNTIAKPGRTRERQVLHHIADYALFMSGVFRERLKYRGQISYYREHGRSAFARCARLEASPQRAAILRNMGQDFEPISDALDRLWHRRLPMPGPETSPLAALWRA
jgi:hypothetical protein